jgi:hypothetical protein
LSPNKLILEEVAYQIVINEVMGIIYQDNKDIFPPLPLWIGTYSFANTKQAQNKVDTLLSYHFGEEIFMRHDPKKIIKEHVNKLGIP